MNRRYIEYSHKPVLLKEVVDFLNVKEGSVYIDATLGGGGYAFEILKRGGIVLGIDMDQDAINYVTEKIKSQGSKIKIGKELILVQGNFRDIYKIAHLYGFENVAGIVFDLGLSSYQIEQSGRGFSFKRDEPLDMRMDVIKGQGMVTAGIIINEWSKEELYELFSKMGEERFAHAVSDNIIRARRLNPIRSSLELGKIVAGAIAEKRETHPATKIFQALRIAVNDEINNLKIGLKDGFAILEERGRIVVVSFHSLEDRIVKNNFRLFERVKKGIVLTKKPVLPSKEEKEGNRRSRSAKLRVIEKVI